MRVRRYRCGKWRPPASISPHLLSLALRQLKLDRILDGPRPCPPRRLWPAHAFAPLEHYQPLCEESRPHSCSNTRTDLPNALGLPNNSGNLHGSKSGPASPRPGKHFETPGSAAGSTDGLVLTRSRSGPSERRRGRCSPPPDVPVKPEPRGDLHDRKEQRTSPGCDHRNSLPNDPAPMACNTDIDAEAAAGLAEGRNIDAEVALPPLEVIDNLNFIPATCPAPFLGFNQPQTPPSSLQMNPPNPPCRLRHKSASAEYASPRVQRPLPSPRAGSSLIKAAEESTIVSSFIGDEIVLGCSSSRTPRRGHSERHRGHAEGEPLRMHLPAPDDVIDIDVRGDRGISAFLLRKLENQALVQLVVGYLNQEDRRHFLSALEYDTRLDAPTDLQDFRDECPSRRASVSCLLEEAMAPACPLDEAWADTESAEGLPPKFHPDGFFLASLSLFLFLFLVSTFFLSFFLARCEKKGVKSLQITRSCAKICIYSYSLCDLCSFQVRIFMLCLIFHQHFNH